jgi:hypothetical protein
MHLRHDPDYHHILVEELVLIFKERGFRILGANSVAGFGPVRPLPNDGYGDQEAKAPDVFAFDPKNRCYVIGEAKTGEGDLETDHALTQYNVYLDQVDAREGTRATLYIILPAAKVPEFNSLITHYIHPDYWKHITVVPSQALPT